VAAVQRAPSASEIEAALRALYIPVATTRLRKEEAQKVRELEPLFAELSAALGKLPRDRPLQLVDAACGRGYVSLLSTKLLLEPPQRAFRWTLIERDEARVRSCESLAAKLGAVGRDLAVCCAEVSDNSAWPAEVDLAVALHACGPAADAVIERAAAASAKVLLLIPCCVSKATLAHEAAARAAASLGVPRQAQVRRRFLESLIAAERTLRLEMHGYLVEVVELCSPTITPHNLLWRCRWLGEHGRMAKAREAHAQLVAR
jgi:hypothetical protein